MWLSELRLRWFRNIARAELSLPDGPILLWGDNGQGKTSLLEAIHFLATGRSFRTRNDRECVSWDAPADEPTLIRGAVTREGESLPIQAALFQGAKRIQIGARPLARLGELVGELNVVLFTPADLALVQGGPAARRRFMDAEISQVSRACLDSLQRYARALKQRNQALRGSRSLSTIQRELQAFEEIMAAASATILSIRGAWLEELGARAAVAYAGLGASESLRLEYKPFLPFESPIDMEDCAARMRARLEADRPVDHRAASTRCGPHRDDFSILLNGREAHDYGSQGQQRSCALALRLAEIDLIVARRGEAPVALLDDLCSELDPTRRRRLLDLILGKGQAFLTSARPDDFARSFEFAASLRMRGGTPDPGVERSLETGATA